MKPSYKQTEVGVIPEDWEVKSLEQLCDPRHSICYGIVQVGAHSENGTAVLAIKNLNGDYTSNIHRCSAHIEQPYIRSRVCPGDILISVKGTIGRIGVVPSHFKGNISRDLARFRLTSADLPKFWHQMLQSETAQRRLQATTVGTTRMELSINPLKKVSMPRPTIDDQRAIAEALSDADALIESLERLIAKKRDIKQGAMQELLTGKKRLPEFTGKWIPTQFNKLLRHHSGNSSLIKGKLSEFPVAGFYPAFSASGQDVWHHCFEYDGNALIVSAVGSRCGKTFKAQGKWCAIANTHVVWPDLNMVDDQFLLLFLNDENFWIKSGSGQPFVLFMQSFRRTISIPTLPEQTAIATVIFDMDAEIEALEGKLAKARAIKQGMMQELLTGRIRLI